MFDSVQYNLSNPAFTEDIGEANLDRMLPMAPATFAGGTYYPGITGTMDNITLRGGLEGDKFETETQKQKDSKVWKGILATAGAVVAGVVGFKYGKKGLSAIWTKLKNVCTKIKTKLTK